jgi:hypothetical protein
MNPPICTGWGFKAAFFSFKGAGQGKGGQIASMSGYQERFDSIGDT